MDEKPEAEHREPEHQSRNNSHRGKSASEMLFGHKNAATKKKA